MTDDYVRDGYVHTLQDKEIPDYVAIFRVHGPFLFGATDKISEITDRIDAAAADRHRAPEEHDA